MNTGAVAGLLLVAGAALAQVEPVEIPLDRCTLHWDMSSGLTVTYDGRTVLGGSTSPVVAHPTDWTWSHRVWGGETMTTVRGSEGDKHIFVVSCADEKVAWTQFVTAGPGDRFTVKYEYRQDGWDEEMRSQVCLFTPATSWLVGHEFRTSGPDGEVTGRIPPTFEGAAHPFANATHMEFDTLFGRLTVDATQPITLFDYAHRNHLWLGRDDTFPRTEEQSWSAEFAFEPRALVIGGVRIDQCLAPDRVEGERMELELSLARTADGPQSVTARLTVDTGDPPATDEREIALTEEAQPVTLTAAMPGPGRYSFRFALIANGEQVYESPPLSTSVPRYLTILPGRMPYTTERQGAALVMVDEEAEEGLRVTVEGPQGELFAGAAEAGRRIEAPLDLTTLPLGRTELVATLYRGEERLGTARCELLRAEPREHVVAIDNRSHGLIVDGLPFIARSFYADYSTVAKDVETEPPRGFNAVAPYLSGDIETRRGIRDDIRALLDRCAAVGMWMQLDIRTASKPPHTEEKWAWVQEEVEAFRDHPALLAYYLADEPELGWASPEDTITAYRKIKEWDPCHPITMVFCRSADAARYADGMDIIMTDPYPIPNGAVTAVTDFCRRIREDTGDMLPVWLVPQAFGGGEGWRREPSRQEERVMTYLGLIHGAKGVQPFVRRPPIGNPTSPDLWNECRRLALEVGELTPALASGEEAPRVMCSASQVNVAAFQERGAVTVLAANVTNAPLQIALFIDAEFTGKAEALFENRSVEVDDSEWADMIDGFGTRAYRLQVEPAPADHVTLDPANLVVNPSFEQAHNVGTPDGSYLSVGADTAASWHVDPRLAVHGRQSLRLTTPTEDQGLVVRPFPIRLEPGKRYRIAVWARGMQEGLRFSLTLDALTAEEGTHTLTTDWQSYGGEFTASEQAGGRSHVVLRLLSAGTAWFDALQVVAL